MARVALNQTRNRKIRHFLPRDPNLQRTHSAAVVLFGDVLTEIHDEEVRYRANEEGAVRFQLRVVDGPGWMSLMSSGSRRPSSIPSKLTDQMLTIRILSD